MDGVIVKSCLAIVCVTIIEVVALCKGKNGFMLRMAIAMIALLAGLAIGDLMHLH